MQVTLSPHAEQLLRDQLARGGRSPEEVVERALEVLHSEDDWLVENRDSIDSKIRRGLEELDRGESISGEVSRARLKEKKVAWLRENEPRE